jgi:hypothetical protein
LHRCATPESDHSAVARATALQTVVMEIYFYYRRRCRPSAGALRPRQRAQARCKRVSCSKYVLRCLEVGRCLYLVNAGGLKVHITVDPVDFIARLAALVPKQRVNLTRYHGVLAPSSRWRERVTPVKRGKSAKRIANTDIHSPAERHVAMSWAQRLKRVFNIEVRDHCGGSIKVIACIEDQGVIDSILAHLREKEQGRPTLSHLVPTSRPPPGPFPLFAGRESTAPNQQGRY